MRGIAKGSVGSPGIVRLFFWAKEMFLKPLQAAKTSAQLFQATKAAVLLS